MNEFPGEVQELFRGYREFHQDVDPSPEFMGRLWRAIEKRQSPVFALRRMARLVAWSAVAAAIVMGAVLIPLLENSHTAGYYADVVARHHSAEQFQYAATVPVVMVSHEVPVR